MTKILMIKFLKIIHLAVMLILLFGWLGNSQGFLIFHICLVPLVMVQWWLNDGTCILTNIENYISGEIKVKSDEQGQFSRSVFKKLFRFTPTDKMLKIVIYLILAASWVGSVLQLIR